jgi:hypothetical protein
VTLLAIALLQERNLRRNASGNVLVGIYDESKSLRKGAR